MGIRSPRTVSGQVVRHLGLPVDRSAGRTGRRLDRPPPRDPEPLPYLADSGKQGLDLNLEVRVNGNLVSTPPFASMYWTGAQMLAHMTVNGALTRTGDLYASGTVSGPRSDECGSLIELTQGGARPLTLPDQSVRTFLEDDDEVTVSGTAPCAGGTHIGLGDVSGRILAAPEES
jgi:fumarylacetoacetase